VGACTARLFFPIAMSLAPGQSFSIVALQLDCSSPLSRYERSFDLGMM